MFLPHPLESTNKCDACVPDYFPHTDGAFQHAQLLDCHYPYPLFYYAPSAVLVGGKPILLYRVQPYDEQEVRKHHYEQARAAYQSIYEIQQLLTRERAKYAQTPYIIQQPYVYAPKQPFEYSTSTRYIHEELARDLVYPRHTVDTRGTDVAAVAGNDRIAVGGAYPTETSPFDMMHDELMGAFNLIHTSAQQQRAQQEQYRAWQYQQYYQQMYFQQYYIAQPPIPIQEPRQASYLPVQPYGQNMVFAPPELPGGYNPQYVIYNSDFLIQYAQHIMTAYQAQPQPPFDQASPSAPHLVSSNTAKSPVNVAQNANESLYIECEMDEEVAQIVAKSDYVCKSAANMIAETKQKIGGDIELELGSNDLGISSTSQSNVAPATTIPVALSEESAEQKAKPAQKKLVRQPQPYYQKPQQQQQKQREKPSSVKRQPATRPESVLHQINESKSNDELNESAYIKGILAGNDSTLIDIDTSVHNSQLPNSGRKSPLKQKIEKKPVAKSQKKKPAKKEQKMEISEDSFLRYLDNGKINFNKQAYKNDFDDLELDDDDL